MQKLLKGLVIPFVSCSILISKDSSQQREILALSLRRSVCAYYTLAYYSAVYCPTTGSVSHNNIWFCYAFLSRINKGDITDFPLCIIKLWFIHKIDFLGMNHIFIVINFANEKNWPCFCKCDWGLQNVMEIFQPFHFVWGWGSLVFDFLKQMRVTA